MSTAIAPANGNGTQAAKVDIMRLPVRQLLQQDEIKSQIAKALPSHMKPERMIRVATTALMRQPKLLSCTQDSFLKCMLDLSALGLEPDGRRAHLIPFEDRKNNVTICTLVIDYKGYVELVRRSASVSKIHADVVCDGDVFEHNLGEVLKHSYDLRSDRDDATWYAVYAMVEFKDKSTQAVIMSRKQVEKIRDKSQGWIAAKKYNKPHPWGENEPEMAKKTAFRRLTKWLTLSPEIMDAIQSEDDSEGVIETTAARIEYASGNDRLAALLTEPKTETSEESDGGPTPEDVAGNFNHDATERTGGGETIAEAMQRIQTLLDEAKTAADVDGIVHSEIASGDYTGPQAERIDALGATRKRIIAGAKTK